MNFFLHIKITSDQFNFNDEVLKAVKSDAPELSCMDIDNFSDVLTIETALRALKEAKKSLIFIEVHHGTELGHIMKMLQYFARPVRPLKIIYSGNHPLLNKMKPAFGDNICRGDINILKKKLEWLKT